MVGQLGSMAVGAGDRKALLQYNLSQAAHADAADADEMNGYRIMKMKLIHTIHILVFLSFAAAYHLVSQRFPVAIFTAIV